MQRQRIYDDPTILSASPADTPAQTYLFSVPVLKTEEEILERVLYDIIQQKERLSSQIENYQKNKLISTGSITRLPGVTETKYTLPTRKDCMRSVQYNSAKLKATHLAALTKDFSDRLVHETLRIGAWRRGALATERVMLEVEDHRASLRRLSEIRARDNNTHYTRLVHLRRQLDQKFQEERHRAESSVHEEVVRALEEHNQTLIKNSERLRRFLSAARLEAERRTSTGLHVPGALPPIDAIAFRQEQSFVPKQLMQLHTPRLAKKPAPPPSPKRQLELAPAAPAPGSTAEPPRVPEPPAAAAAQTFVTALPDSFEASAPHSLLDASDTRALDASRAHASETQVDQLFRLQAEVARRGASLREHRRLVDEELGCLRRRYRSAQRQWTTARQAAGVILRERQELRLFLLKALQDAVEQERWKLEQSRQIELRIGSTIPRADDPEGASQLRRAVRAHPLAARGANMPDEPIAPDALFRPHRRLPAAEREVVLRELFALFELDPAAPAAAPH
eukprot:gnl/Chilomastix_cuspidata/3631.p1 GENE.gnl/Chilomastix_cuspidata/3631~~gnl/Chilomastix_cuspidata/3631.p1  ORF type:complete len:509 (-),score=185.08 gnl/Chilomastix_cuspidata/3631:894-2420(-)